VAVGHVQNFLFLKILFLAKKRKKKETPRRPHRQRGGVRKGIGFPEQEKIQEKSKGGTGRRALGQKRSQGQGERRRALADVHTAHDLARGGGEFCEKKGGGGTSP